MTLYPFERRGEELIDRPSSWGSSRDLLHPRDEPEAPEAPSPAQLATWITRLREGHWDTVQELVRHRGFDGVRAALVAACDEDLSDDETVTTALAQTGGPGAREALARRVARLSMREDTFTDATASKRAVYLANLAKACLGLDPEATDVARALTRLFTHPSAHARMFAVWRATEHRARPSHPSTAATDILDAALVTLVDTPEKDVFVKAFPALWFLARDGACARLGPLLHDENPWVRHEAVNAALLAHNARALLPSLVGWLAGESSLRLAMDFAEPLAPFAPVDLVYALASRALTDPAPSLRLAGAHLAAHLDADARRPLLDAALAAEPDPDLREVFARAR